ncbi:MAG: phage holin family protein [Kineosporiaceae bacterium]|jgi:hypothetical protein|nr:phage holin family protein [Kineosporiaceae bacterium]MBK7623922.1 phage holin family protein [Kineosporiaceae bacterium]MBK8075542.1 phage holin family protein [Kineosporiaceae bacterium]
MAEPTTATSQERTLGQLVAQATDDMSAILRAEMALAKAEIAADVRNGAVAGGLFGAAGYLGLLASILLSIAAGYGLVAVGLAPWLAFLVVALVCLLLAAVLVLVGKSRVSRVGPPERAMRSARQTIAAVTPTRSR